ncbi:hypothetical protein BC835DRAFT_90467 [Cytidiella melzeri]|nr:hypothetical protein BC835DRAFT_90467 [Cytidiella melzeri]
MSLEMHDIPTNATSEPLSVMLTPHGSRYIHGRTWDQIFITDHETSAGKSVLFPEQGEQALPLSIFVCTTGSKPGLEHIVISPQCVSSPPPRSVALQRSSPNHHHRYLLAHAAHRRLLKAPRHTQLRLLSGSLRTLVLTIPNKSITDMPPISAMYKLEGQCAPQNIPFTQVALGLKALPVVFHDDTKIYTFAWDETVGRALFANEGRISVVDFSHMPLQGVWITVVWLSRLGSHCASSSDLADVLGRRIPLAARQEHHADKLVTGTITASVTDRQVKDAFW